MQLINIYRTIFLVIFAISLACTFIYVMEYREIYKYSDQKYNINSTQFSDSDKQSSDSDKQSSDNNKQSSDSVIISSDSDKQSNDSDEPSVVGDQQYSDIKLQFIHNTLQYKQSNKQYHSNQQYDHSNQQHGQRNQQYNHNNPQYDHINQQYNHNNQQYDHSKEQYSHSEREAKPNYTPSWKWINRPEDDFNILVSSVAYHDDRNPSLSYLRIYWIFSKNMPTLFWDNLRFVAQYKPEGLKTNEVLLSEHIVHKHHAIARKIENLPHSQFMMSLPLRSFRYIPLRLLLFSNGFTEVNHTINIIQPTNYQPVQFLVCVKSMYGQIEDSKIPRLVEWIEMNKLLGVSEFHFYNVSLTTSKYLTSMLQYYNKEIHVHQFGANFTYQDNNNATKYRGNEEFQAAEVLSRAAYSDCIYRNYKRVQHLVLIDMDELIIPRQDMNYSSLLARLNQISSGYINATSITFEMAMFYTHYGKDENQPQYLHTLQYRKKITYNQSYGVMKLVRRKSFINPKTCVIAFHHNCLQAISGRVRRIMLVPGELGLVHHYRDSVSWDKVSSLEQPVNDDVMLKYKTMLHSSVSKTLNVLNYKLS